MAGGSCRAGRDDRGFVTAEAAVVLPVLVVVLAVALWLLACLSAQLRCVDAARVAARLAARGETAAAVQEAGRAAAPHGAAVEVAQDGEDVVVVVRVRLRPLPALPAVPAVELEARSTALREEPVEGLP